MPGSVTGAADFAALSRRLKEAGETGLRRELYRNISKAAGPLADEISSAAHLRPYMPDRYAETLAADLRVSVSRRTGNDPGVSIRAKGRAHSRKLQQLDDGSITHRCGATASTGSGSGPRCAPGSSPTPPST